MAQYPDTQVLIGVFINLFKTPQVTDGQEGQGGFLFKTSFV